jgi:hypothetical protein
MKRTISFFLIFSLCCISSPIYGSSLREVELIDGSVLRAHVLSMDGKTYRLQSETLGEFEIPEYRVKAIRAPHGQSVSAQSRNTATPLPQSSGETEPDVPTSSPLPFRSPPTTLPAASDLQQALSQNPAAMGKVLSLQNDPLVQDILGDASLMQAIHSGNLGALLNDPKIRALMSHPTVRDLGSQYGR